MTAWAVALGQQVSKAPLGSILGAEGPYILWGPGNENQIPKEAGPSCGYRTPKWDVWGYPTSGSASLNPQPTVA